MNCGLHKVCGMPESLHQHPPHASLGNFSKMWTIKSRDVRLALRLTLYSLFPLCFLYGSEATFSVVKIIALHVLLYFVSFYHLNMFCFVFPLDFVLTMIEIAAYIILWRRFISGEPAYLSLTVFDITSAVILFLIGYLKFTDFVNASNHDHLYDFYGVRSRKLVNVQEPSTFVSVLNRTIGLRGQAVPFSIRLSLTAVLVNCSIFLTVALAWNVIIIAPLRETDSIPIRESRSLLYPTELKISPQFTAWNVIVGRAQNSGLNQGDIDWSADVKVDVLSEGNHTSSCPLVPAYESVTSKDLFPQTRMIFHFVTFQCPFQSEALVTVNFTNFGIVLDSIGSSGINSVQIMAGSAPNDIIRRRTSVPASLLPGMNLVGFAKQNVLQLFRNRALSSLGVFTAYDTFVLSEITNLNPDPLSSASQLIPHSPNIGTLRIVPLADFSEWQIIQEFRDRSVLKGFSTVGGLWTFVGLVVSLLFGTSCFQLYFDKKPLSIFGLVDQFRKETTKTQFQKKYAELETDLKRPGFARFMADRLVDLSIIESDRADENQQMEEEDNRRLVWHRW